MAKRFKEYSGLNLPEINNCVLGMWSDENVFHRTMSEREGCPSFVFFEGPPSANGRPGIHHVLARTIKDIFCRYKTMQGFQVKRKAGWDTHGLPVELGVEKNLGITKEDIGKKISVDEYNAACRREVMKFTGEWEDLTSRMGYWVDMPNAYITYDNRYIETVWWLLGELYKKGYLYKGYTIQPYSPAAGTGLSSHELNQPGCYRDVKDTTCVAQFKVVDNDSPALSPYREILFKWGTPYFLAWTTTPWTLPSNTALAVGPEIQYNIVRTYNPYSGKPITVVVADALMASLFNPKATSLPMDGYVKGDKLVPYEVAAQVKGLDLVGIDYEQLLPWVNPGEGAFRVIPGDYVTTDDGTGIVHIAGTFGADDLRVSKQSGVPPLHLIDRDGNIRPMVDMSGRFYLLSDLDPKFVEEMVDVEAYTPWQGQYVKNAYDPDAAPDAETLDVKICMELKATDKVFKIEKHTHNYPHCWRTDKPVLYYPLDSWFIKTTAVRERLMELNEGINWKPASTGSGRFGKWLENLQDWNLSRSRYWGTPLPIWRTEDGSEELCISSVEQLCAEMDRAVEAGLMKENLYRKAGFVPGDYSKENYDRIDLHRPYVDDIILLSSTGKPMYREKDLIDVWFDSGSMPYAQIHYPFENKEAFDNREVYPADFIAEGVDQTRGWFFTLHAIAGMLFDSVAYKAVVSNGLVLDKFGNKMSKRLGNAVDPFGQIEKFGADPVRWYMISNSSPWDNLKYDENGVAETSRKFFSTLYNTYGFFALYANLDGFDPSAQAIPVSERPEIDRWVLSLLNTLVGDVTEALDDYEPTRAARAVSEFVDSLSNWYVRLNRKRFWNGDTAAYQTLYHCLETVSRLIAPFAPFYADELYRALTGSDVSVHLASFPAVDVSLSAPELEKRQRLAQDIVSMSLALRRKVNIKVRQPLSTLMVPALDADMRSMLEAISGLVKDEINVKDLKIVSGDENIIVKSARPDFKKLGPKHGKNMKAVAEAIKNLDHAGVAALEADGYINLSINGVETRVDACDVDIISEDIPGWLVANNGPVTIALDVTVTPELKREGIAREIVNRVQNIRKQSGFEVTDRISLVFSSSEATDEAIREHADYISRQVLANSLDIATVDPEAEGVSQLDIDDVNIYVKISLNK
ncbi:isoleucine--tRNA ligase [Duncaniella muricolitica]|jgi:isoleucyl-tRNA synthetase|uniref:isoleucine--tRNA ligase n=1 Tax=Duncaniella muricolitica TaxID=2880704 RepID=UPI00244E5050|nr:isoleucine--tRNA ligase [Duncaniella muricolitica]